MTTSTITGTYGALAVRIAERLGNPLVRGLYLPQPDRSHAKDAGFCAIELDDGSVGFSYVSIGSVDPSLRGGPEADEFAGMEVAALARGYAGRDPAGKALGLAAINALSQQLFARANWTPPAADDSFGDIAPRAGEHIGMIGLFPPLIPQVRQTGARLTVLELKPELAGERGDYRVTLDPAELATCEKVVSTCTVLLNDTLDAVLAACRNASHFAVVGPTAGCVPDPLFARGVDSIGGRRVVDPDGFRDAFRQGKKWGSFTSKYVIARAGYPGIDALLERIS